MGATLVARILHGSHLFGTATEDSDTDYKSVWIPSREAILLGRVGWSSNDGGTSDSSRPNTRFDIDDERHDLVRFVNLLATGQPMALEMLFAPRNFHREEPHRSWTLLQENAERVLSRESGKFLGYCRRQAMAYGLKGERVEAAEKAVAALRAAVSSFGPKARLGPHMDGVIAAVGSDHVRDEPKTMQTGRVIRHLRVAGKMAAETLTLAEALSIAEGVVADYGERSRRSREASGKDWKALSHALRIGYEAVELFSHGRITLPRPEAAHLLDVKMGRIHADEVGEEIVSLLADVEKAAERSGLPAKPDVAFLERLVIDVHAEAVGAFGPSESPAPRA